jgi:hypothetical protein
VADNGLTPDGVVALAQHVKRAAETKAQASEVVGPMMSAGTVVRARPFFSQ